MIENKFGNYTIQLAPLGSKFFSKDFQRRLHKLFDALNERIAEIDEELARLKALF